MRTFQHCGDLENRPPIRDSNRPETCTITLAPDQCLYPNIHLDEGLPEKSGGSGPTLPHKLVSTSLADEAEQADSIRLPSDRRKPTEQSFLSRLLCSACELKSYQQTYETRPDCWLIHMGAASLQAVELRFAAGIVATRTNLVGGPHGERPIHYLVLSSWLSWTPLEER